MPIKNKFIPYLPLQKKQDNCEQNAKQFLQEMESRRSLRHFSDRAVSQATIETIIKTANTAPSGANKQPWHFCAISNPALKAEIKTAAEKEEKEFYQNRASQEWLKDLMPFGTNWHKPFLQTAPWIIVVFKKVYNLKDQQKTKNYYVQESVGIATGLLITAIHQAGLVTLTHTPSPMNFLSDILNRPENEKPFLLLPVGYPDTNAQVPHIKRKSLQEISTFYL